MFFLLTALVITKTEQYDVWDVDASFKRNWFMSNEIWELSKENIARVVVNLTKICILLMFINPFEFWKLKRLGDLLLRSFT